MVAEGDPVAKHPQFENAYVGGHYVIMEASPPRMDSPSPDKVSSAADAMLKLSNSAHTSASQMFMLQGNLGVAVHPGQSQAHVPIDNLLEKTRAAMNPLLKSVEPDLSLVNSAHRMIRKQREFIPDTKKDNHYWVKRKKNNEAAKRSREKRRVNDMVLGQKIVEVSDENQKLKNELEAIKKEYGLPVDRPFKSDQPYQTDSNNVSIMSPTSVSSDSNSCQSNGCCSQISKVELAQLLAPTVTQQLNHFPLQPEPSQTTPPKQIAIAPGALPLLIPVSTPQPVTLLATVLQPGMMTNGTGMSNLPLNTLPTSMPIKQEICEESQDSYIVNSAAGNETAAFHSRLQAPQICRPISPDTDSSSPQSLTIAFSNASSSDNSDCERHDAPLNLCKRLPGNLIEITPQEERSVRSRERKGIPHKLRHKEQFRQNDLSESENSGPEESQGMPMHVEDTDEHHMENLRYETHDQQYEQNQWTSNLTDNTTSGEDTPQNQFDPKYVEHRNRNNFAARKCRENRKMLNHMRMTKSNVLETENHKLKEELRNLADEVMNLKEWISKKNDAKAKGEKFSPPPLDIIQPSGQSSPSGSTL